LAFRGHIYSCIGHSDALKSLILPKDHDIGHFLKHEKRNFEFENKIKTLLDDIKLVTKDKSSIIQKPSLEYHHLKLEQRKIRQQIDEANKTENAIDLRACFWNRKLYEDNCTVTS
jgi:hypothetical protein